MPRVVLLGDSVFDNGAYVLGGPDVATQLRRLLPAEWKVTLLALDAASMEDIPRQLTPIPADATHLVLSIGGNDALRHAELLEASIGVDVLARLADAAAAFAPRYEETLASVHGRRLPLLACTIYEGNMGGSLQKRAMGAVAVFNDRIQRAALRRGIPVLELRDLFTESADYANPIEPSQAGGEKVARAIRNWLVGEP
ncbi:MAG: SGNH/GDSL hydrolase family protein [Gemmatimonadaceae bacterium]|nr:SGNH/GDSL hydrolase family protein [Gemmatimonadaceae bacterium]